MRRWIAVSLLAVTAVGAAPCLALPPLPLAEIVDTVRGLAADQIGVRKEDLDTVRSLAAQGLSETGLHELVIAMQDEFGVVLPDDEIYRAKYNDSLVGLSVRRLAQLVFDHMHPQA